MAESAVQRLSPSAADRTPHEDAGLAATIDLPEIDASLPLSDIYDGRTFECV